MEYLLHIAILAAIYVTLAVSLDLQVGHTGLLSISHAAFFGIGAYASALLAIHLGTAFPLGIAVGMLLAIMVSFCISLTSLRVRGEYFAIATFAFQVIVFSILQNWMSVTRGPLGIAAIPQPRVLNWTVDSPVKFLVLAGAWALACHCAVSRIVASPFGRVLRVIREDEVFAQSFGKNTSAKKMVVFAISAAFAASAGSIAAHYISVTVNESPALRAVVS